MIFTAREKRRAAERELGQRRFVYPNRVGAGKMTQKKADYEIAIMEQIAADYKKLEEQESPTLFTNSGATDGESK